MNIGTQLTASGTSSISVFTPWFRRHADNARFTYEVFNVLGTPSFTVDVYHKAAEDTGPGTALSVTWDTIGNFKAGTAVGLKEMVRLLITLEGSGSTGETESLFYRFLEPTWFDQASSSAP